MTPEIITATSGLGQYGAIGISVLSMIGIVAVVLATFKFNANQSELNRKAIAEQSTLNRESHKENTTVMTGALKEVSTIVSSFAKENREDHIKMQNTDAVILEKLSDRR